MRAWLFASVCLGLAACSQKAENSPANDAPVTTDISDRSSSGQPDAPAIGVTAAPGVAFAYDYAFRLPSDAIAKTQEVHAQACEKLGVARCRITGMRYRLLGENNIEAMLAFKLDPAIARGFGKDAVAAVDAAKGKLVDAAVSGTDAGAEIRRLDVQRGRTEATIARIDAQLTDPRSKGSEREELQRQRDALTQTVAAAKDDTGAQQASLATTPMVFRYGSGAAVRGFDPSAPLTSAADTAIGSVQFTLAFVLGAVALFGPPGVLVLVAVLIWRRFRPARMAAMPS